MEKIAEEISITEKEWQEVEKKLNSGFTSALKTSHAARLVSSKKKAVDTAGVVVDVPRLYRDKVGTTRDIEIVVKGDEEDQVATYKLHVEYLYSNTDTQVSALVSIAVNKRESDYNFIFSAAVYNNSIKSVTYSCPGVCASVGLTLEIPFEGCTITTHEGKTVLKKKENSVMGVIMHELFIIPIIRKRYNMARNKANN
jgi:hypothetical protein